MCDYHSIYTELSYILLVNSWSVFIILTICVQCLISHSQQVSLTTRAIHCFIKCWWLMLNGMIWFLVCQVLWIIHGNSKVFVGSSIFCLLFVVCISTSLKQQLFQSCDVFSDALLVLVIKFHKVRQHAT